MIRLLEPWRTRLLWLSLGANLFLAALVVVPHVWPHGPAGPPGPPGFDRLVERMARNLPADDAAMFRAAMARERPWYDMSRERLEGARAEIGRQIGQQPFDPAATHAAMTAMQAQLREAGARFDDSLVLALGSLSPAGRRLLAENMTRRRP